MMRLSVPAAIDILREGGIVALPTETVYGLSARIDSEAALKQVFLTKERPSFDPLIVHVENPGQASRLCAEWPELYQKLAEKFWPGPLTLVAKKRPEVSTTISAGLETVALRSPRHPLFQEVLRGLGVPLAAPSANRFGRTSPTTAQHVRDEFHEQVPVVDGGPCQVGVESTVLSAEKVGTRWEIQILRPGGLSRAELEEFLTKVQIDFSIVRRHSVHSPGHLKEHYQPESPLIILEDKEWSAHIQQQVEKKLGRKLSGASELRLMPTPQESARQLYSQMRQLSRTPAQILWVKRTQDTRSVAWEVIWDRLERASSAII